MLRKKLLLLIFALVATITTQANNDYSTLVVETKSGTTLEISLQKKPRVQISETEFIIYFDNKAEGYVHEEVRKFYFKPYNATNIEAPVEKNTIRVSDFNHPKKEYEYIPLHCISCLTGTGIFCETYRLSGMNRFVPCYRLLKFLAEHF